MFHRDGGRLPQVIEVPDWDSIEADVSKELVSRWPNLDRASIDSAVHLGVAIANQTITAGEVVDNPAGLVRQIAFRSLRNDHKRCSSREITNFDFSRIQEAPKSPEAILMQRETISAIHDAILSLPELYQVPLVAHLLYDVSYEDISQGLQISESTARMRVSRAKKMIREYVEAREA